MERRQLVGVLAACASAMLGGTAVVATRAVIAATDPATLATLRFSIGSLCLVPIVALTGLPWPGRRDAFRIGLLGILFFTAFPWLFNQALKWTTAAHGALALSTMPFLTLLIAAALGTETLTLRKLAGVAVAMLGVATALSAQLRGMPEGAWRGDLVMVAGAFCGSLYNALARDYLRRYPALPLTASAMLAGTAAMAVLALLTGQPARVLAFTPGTWAAVLYLGVAGAALAFFLWSYALERITPTGVAVTVALNPVMALSLGTLLLDEPWSVRLLLGLLAVAAGVILVNSGGRVSEPPLPGEARDHPVGRDAVLR